MLWKKVWTYEKLTLIDSNCPVFYKFPFQNIFELESQQKQ